MIRDDDYPDMPSVSSAFPKFTSQYLETEIENERIGLTLWDSHGFEANVVDLQLREITSFIESKFEETFSEEQKVIRSPGVRDTHIHCVFLVLDPVRLDANIAAAKKADMTNGAIADANSFRKPQKPRPLNGLDENLDVQVIRSLQGKTTVIPIISKADTITTAHMMHLKRVVWDSLKSANLDTLEALGRDDDDSDEGSDDAPDGQHNHHNLDERDEDRAAAHAERSNSKDDKFSITSHLDSPSSDDEGSTSAFSASEYDLAKPSKAVASTNGPTQSRNASVTQVSQPEVPPLPLSIISPDSYSPEIIGRKFPWGFADPYNTEHCDFVKVKEVVFGEWRGDLREASREMWYERWRTSRLNRKARREGYVRSEGDIGGMGFAR